MGFSWDIIKESLYEKYNVRDELISAGNIQFIGASRAMFSSRYSTVVFCLEGKDLVITPVVNNELLLAEEKHISSNQIKHISIKQSFLSLFIQKTLFVELKNGEMLKCFISRKNSKSMSRIIYILGF